MEQARSGPEQGTVGGPKSRGGGSGVGGYEIQASCVCFFRQKKNLVQGGSRGASMEAKEMILFWYAAAQCCPSALVFGCQSCQQATDLRAQDMAFRLALQTPRVSARRAAAPGGCKTGAVRCCGHSHDSSTLHEGGIQALRARAGRCEPHCNSACSACCTTRWQELRPLTIWCSTELAAGWWSSPRLPRLC